MRLTVVQHPERMWKKEVVPEPKSYKISFLNSYGKFCCVIFMYTFLLRSMRYTHIRKACMPSHCGNARAPVVIDIIIILIIPEQRISSG